MSEEVYREYYRAEDKERYFMGRLKKGHTKVNPETKEIRYIPSRELSYEQLVEQDWQKKSDYFSINFLSLSKSLFFR